MPTQVDDPKYTTGQQVQTAGGGVGEVVDVRPANCYKVKIGESEVWSPEDELTPASASDTPAEPATDTPAQRIDFPRMRALVDQYPAHASQIVAGFESGESADKIEAGILRKQVAKQSIGVDARAVPVQQSQAVKPGSELTEEQFNANDELVNEYGSFAFYRAFQQAAKTGRVRAK